ncbi:unnamed protein product [Nyctereutes procyonoides]|uniref:Methylated-DNA--protein-cysteine methyltransferase n=1 Tax=Nyctereutes procyonoides TaxID=34880 RepID=A0A811ZD85_NYCPR|nr:unnamed protein product [Nyctereutes procyonoides]
MPAHGQVRGAVVAGGRLPGRLGRGPPRAWATEPVISGASGLVGREARRDSSVISVAAGEARCRPTAARRRAVHEAGLRGGRAENKFRFIVEMEICVMALKIWFYVPAEAPALPELLGCPEEMTEPLVQCVAWLDAYFREPSVLPGLPLPAIHHPIFQRGSFTARVLQKLLELVKFGDTVSYQQLAALAGSPKAARAVGGAMRSNPVPILIPCHRVVCSSGAMGNYTGGLATKEWLLC